MRYLRPAQLEVALEAIASQNVQIVAGGTDVFPAMDSFDPHAHVLDVTRIDALRGIESLADGIRIGAATTWSEILHSGLPAAFDGLKDAGREVGSVQIQNAGTLGGNLCNASPAADGVPPLLTLNAEVEVASAERGHERVALSEFIYGVRKTSLLPDQLVTAVFIPTPPDNALSAFTKLGSRHYLVISIAMTAVLLRLDDNGLIADIRLAVGACSAVSKRLATLESRLRGTHPRELAIDAADLPELSPIDDVRGTADYRRDVVVEQCDRTIIRACRYE